MSFNFFVFLFQFVMFSIAIYIPGGYEETPTLEWPEEFHIKGVKVTLSDKKVDPFEIWYSATFNRSRKDTLDGVSKKYYYGATEDAESLLFEVHPESNEETKNELKCYKESYDDNIKKFLPALRDYKYLGKEKLNEINADKWVRDLDTGFIIERIVLWTTVKGDDTIPLRFELQTYIASVGSSKTNIIGEYWDYQPFASEDDLSVEKNHKCVPKPSHNDDVRNEIKSKYDVVSGNNVEQDVSKLFDRYKLKYKKQYKDEDEHAMRMEVFKNNLEHVIRKNQQNLDYKLELNQFADMTAEEIKYLTATRPSNAQRFSANEYPYIDKELEDIINEIPEEIDFRLQGVLTPVKHQGSCGSCWAFTTTAVVEGAVALKNGGRNLDLSEQSLVDCAWGYNNFGCEGGELDDAMKYVLKHGIPTEKDYGPYLEADGYCKLDNMTELQKIKGFGRVTHRSVNAMKVALNKFGPVAVSIYAGVDFMLYHSGVLYDPQCNKTVNHGVVIVGYGARDDTPYWIVRNSWGEQWGEDGYVLMAALDNNCQILDDGHYVVA